jgi:hypothetical protein
VTATKSACLKGAGETRGIPTGMLPTLNATRAQ